MFSFVWIIDDTGQKKPIQVNQQDDVGDLRIILANQRKVDEARIILRYRVTNRSNYYTEVRENFLRDGRTLAEYKIDSGDFIRMHILAYQPQAEIII